MLSRKVRGRMDWASVAQFLATLKAHLGGSYEFKEVWLCFFFSSPQVQAQDNGEVDLTSVTR